MKAQSTTLDSISSQLSNIKISANPYPELIAFLASNFNAVLESNRGYIKLFADLVTNYLTAIGPAVSPAELPEVSSFLASIERDAKERLGAVAKRVKLILMGSVDKWQLHFWVMELFQWSLRRRLRSTSRRKIR